VSLRLAARLGRENNFDAIRLAAASLVIVSHAFPLSSGDNRAEPLYRLSGGQSTLGHLAVLVFFVVSGFLITRSFERSPNLADFARNRALRLLPALVCMVAAMTLLLGPLLTKLPLAEYFTDSRFASYWLNVTLVTTRYSLPGLFEANPFPRAVNGVLWTLRYEAFFYAVTAGLGVLGLLRGRVLVGLVAIALFVPWLGDVPGDSYLRMFRCYAAGSALCLYKDAVPLDGRLAAGALAACALAARLGGFDEVFAVAGGYLVIYLAFAPWLPLSGAGRFGDFSYGLYIYGFPMQQAVAQVLGAGHGWALNLALGFPLALAFAILSWHGIEKRALRRKRRALHPVPAS
jgi:peptidoglycan/LPS O-acetylase OafA/YrhL